MSHTREKLQYVEKMNENENKKLSELRDTLSLDKTKQNNYKKEREKLLRINQKLKQQTGIVNKKELAQDYEARIVEILELKELEA